MNFRILVIDDHEIVLSGTKTVLASRYPDAEIYEAMTVQQGLEQVRTVNPDVVVTDLSMPNKAGEMPTVDNGIQFLRQLLVEHPELNIVVQSSHVKSLIRIKLAIINHEGGFVIVDKSLSMKEMLSKFEWAVEGITFIPKEIKSELEFKPEWLEILRLAFEEGLQDKAIAERMNIAERTVRHYWSKIQDVLDVYPDEGKNIRIQTEKRAREEGIVD